MLDIDPEKEVWDPDYFIAMVTKDIRGTEEHPETILPDYEQGKEGCYWKQADRRCLFSC